MQHRPPRIVYLIGSLREGGGAEKQLYNVVLMLRDSYDVTVIEMAGEGYYGRLLREQGVRTYALGGRSNKDLVAQFRLYRLLRRLKPDALMCWIAGANVIGTFIGRLAGVPRITSSVRCVDDWKGPLYLLLDRVVARLNDRIVVNSEDVRRFVQTTAGVVPEQIFLITNAPSEDLIRYRPNIDRLAFLRAVFPDIAPTHIVLVTSARLHEDKRVLWLAQVFAALKARFPMIKLMVLGRGPQHEEFRGLVHDQLGLAADVAILGWRENVYDYFFAADIYVSVAIREGLSNALIEAQYIGLPCVVTAAGGNSEIMENGVTGYLTALDASTETLVTQLEMLCRDEPLRRKLGEAAAGRARHTFSSEATLRRYDELYTALLDS